MPVFRKVRTGVSLLTAPKRERVKAAYRNKFFNTPVHRNILLVGSPRSGTTWLGNILGCLPGYSKINEPFSLATPGLEEAGFSWNTTRSANDVWSHGYSLVEEILNGRRFHNAALDGNTPWQVLVSRSAVFKVIRGNRMLPWIAENFRLQCIFYLMRHPCAVISSQVSHPLFPSYYAALDRDLEFVDLFMPHLSEYGRSISGEIEARAFTWALDQCFPLLFEREGGWIQVRYEDLVIYGERELRRVFNKTDLQVTRKMKRELHRPSRESHEWSADHQRENTEGRAGGWRKRLACEEVKKILAVLENVGIEGFSDEFVPDYTRVRFTGRCVLEKSHPVHNVA